MVTSMEQLNISELSDGDLVIYADLDMEFKHNSDKCHTPPCLVPRRRLPFGTQLKPFTHFVTTATGKLECFVVRTTDVDFDFYDSHPNCTPYGYDNSPQV